MPDDSFHMPGDAFSDMAGYVWSMYQRFLGEGATLIEAATLATMMFGQMVANAQPSTDDEDDS